MATYALTALVLKKTKLGETDLILTLLGSDGAQYRGVAKGARKPGSKFGGRGEPGTVFQALMARGKSLDVITDAKTIQSHRALREEYDATLALSVILDFAAVVSQESLAEERFYELTAATLDALEQVVKSDKETSLQSELNEGVGCDRGKSELLKLVLTAYLLKASAMQGYRPDFDEEVFEDTEDILMRYVAYLLGITYAELLEADVTTFPKTDDLFRTVRHFVVTNIPARLKALDYYSRGE